MIMGKKNKITTIDRLKEHASEDGGADFYISLGAGILRSSKHVYYDEEYGKWTVFHSIDGTTNTYSNDRRFYENESNIMEAITEGAFYMY